MKIKTVHIAKHDNPELPGYETRTLLVANGKSDKYGYHKTGIIIAQFFGNTIGEAEELAIVSLNLFEKYIDEQRGNLGG